MSRSDDGLRISRRRALVLAAGIGASVEVVPAVSQAAAATVSPARASRDGAARIMLVRHAERPVSLTAPPFGIDVNGNRDLASLSVRGWTRAGALVELFAPSSGTIRPGVARPTIVFASQPIASSQRPLETITPLADRLRMSVRTPVAPTDTAQIAHILANAKGVRVAAWEHQFIPVIAHALGHVHPTPPSAWPEDRFDIVWVFTRAKGRSWKFTQVPQLLLAGDKHTVIR